MTAHRRSPIRAWTAFVAIALISVALTACKPEPEPTASPTPSSSAAETPTVGVPTGTPTPSPTTAAAGIDLPAECADIYTAGMLGTLQGQVPPLNDPQITMLSTAVVPALEVLNSGAPTLRCTWGVPSQTGIATNVTIVDVDQSAKVLDALSASGFGCEEVDSGTLCTSEETSIDRDDNIYSRGESHFLRGDGWISTAWLTIIPDGYTQDIMSTLWG